VLVCALLHGAFLGAAHRAAHGARGEAQAVHASAASGPSHGEARGAHDAHAGECTPAHFAPWHAFGHEAGADCAAWSAAFGADSTPGMPFATAAIDGCTRCGTCRKAHPPTARPARRFEARAPPFETG
jgi:hypothetical protein